MEAAISELVDNDVLQVDHLTLYQKRMVRDNEISEVRAKAGSTGGKKTQFAKAKVKANNKANTEYEYENEYEGKTEVKNVTKKEVKEAIPQFSEFKAYVLENDKSVDAQALELKYKAWVENGWKDGNGKPIKNWKSKILNTIAYLPKKTRQTNQSIPYDSDY
jgi:hypothetical protein